MILSNNEITIDFFENINYSYKSIGIQLSGGIDSSFVLYCLVKTLQDRDFKNVNIYPLVLYDLKDAHLKTYETVENIIKLIVEKTQTTFIKEPIVVPYYEFKAKSLIYSRQYMRNRYGCEIILSGLTKDMPHSNRPCDPYEAAMKLDPTEKRHWETFSPFLNVDKKFIAEQYKKFKLDDLAKITNSCTVSAITPCKKCWWCEERYWAFNSYDGGINYGIN